MTTHLTTATQAARHYKGRGHTMRYGTTLLATNRVWNNDRAAYDHHAAIFDILNDTGDAATTTIALAIESDETFTDQGHAFAWAIGMVNERESQ